MGRPATPSALLGLFLLVLASLPSRSSSYAWCSSLPSLGKSPISSTAALRRRPSSTGGHLSLGPNSSSVVFPPRPSSPTALYMSETDKKKTTGVYARPSAAIERGSGFFIPGLEGSRVRLLFGILTLVLTYVNNSLGSVTTSGFGVSETVAVLAGILLLLQAAVEFGQELGFGVNVGESSASSGSGSSAASSAAAAASNLEQRLSPALVSLGKKAADVVKWAGATYVALTPASHIIVVSDGGEGTDPSLLYELGDFGSSDDTGDADSGAKAALDEVYKSKGGRISVPADHPSATGLLPESGRRCILLQRVAADAGGEGGRRLCIVVGSNQLLQAFTKNDLKWLGRLAAYVGKEL